MLWVTKPVAACSSLAFFISTCSAAAIFKASSGATFFFCSSTAAFSFSYSSTFCLASASAAKCIRCGNKKISYNCNYKCKQTAMLVVYQHVAASAAALFEASSSSTLFFCSCAFRFTSATDLINYCSKSQVCVLDKIQKEEKKGHELQL
jgi:hypothetical protein